jgi:hypothetical protein
LQLTSQSPVALQVAAPFCTAGHGVHVVEVKHPVAGVFPAQTPAQACSFGPHICPPELALLLDALLLDELPLDALLLLDALPLDALLLLFDAPPMPPIPPAPDGSPPSPPSPAPGPLAVAQPPPSHAPNPSATTKKPSRFVLTTYLRARCSPVFPTSGSFTGPLAVVDEPHSRTHRDDVEDR